MGGMVVCLATVMLGVEFGWRPLPGGGLEYLIQIEPELLEALKAGEYYGADIPPNVRGVRSFRITVGTGDLPREGEIPEAARSSTPEPSAAEPTTPAHAGPAPPGIGRPDFPSSAVPATLTPPDDVQPLASFDRQAAAFVRQAATKPDGSVVEKGESPQSTETPKPWLPLTLALVAFFGASGGMLYFGWIAWDYRRRYQALLGQAASASSRSSS